MRKGLIAAGIVVILGGVTAALYSKSNSSSTNGFKTVPVARGSVVEKALATGAIKPKREIAVKSKISGIVKTSFREIGDRVRPGDPLFEILPDPTPMELTEARREVEIAKNVFDQAKKKYDRSRTLRDQGILATQDWDQVEKDIQDAQIRLSLASERLALTNLADMTTLVFKGTVDEIDVGKLHEGMPAHIKIGALPDAKVDGKIYKISPKSKTAEGATLFDVEIELVPGKDVVLRAGYSANAEIAVREKHDVLTIPERLVTFQDGKASVELPGQGEKDAPVKKQIKTGLSDGMNVEVAEGLTEKDLVIERPPKKIE
jgi:HlyD family secretion protein